MREVTVRTRFLLAVAATATGLVVSTDALAFKVFEDPDKGIVVNVGVLVQPWFQFTKPKVGSPGSPAVPAMNGMPAQRVSQAELGPRRSPFHHSSRAMARAVLPR